MNKLKLTFYSVFLFWSVILLFVFFHNISFNPIKHELRNNDQSFNFFVPQGWGFFTKNPREEVVLVYHQNKEKEWELQSIPNSSPKNMFGLSKRQRRMGMDLSFLLHQMKATKWFTTNTGISLKNLESPTDTITGDFEVLEGDILITKSEPVPWA